MEFSSIIAKMSEKAERKSENDYIKDGLVHCHKCDTPKQCRITIAGNNVVVYCMCECESELQRKKEEENKRIEAEQLIDRYRSLGFKDKRMREFTFENDDGEDQRTTSIMKNYVENFDEFYAKGKGLLLYGKCGTGKTFAACEVASALIEKGRPCLVTNIAYIVNTLSGFDDSKEYIDSLNKFDLLVIDDFGTERRTEFMEEQLFSVIDARYRSGKPMIITTNLSLDEIKSPKTEGGERLFDRIIERCMPIEVNGVNRRRKQVCKDYDDFRKKLGF